MDLYPDDVDETVVPRVEPKNKDKNDLKAALKALAKKADGKGRFVASSEAWVECQRVLPGVFTVDEFHAVCRDLQAEWDVKRAAKVVPLP